MSYRLFVVDDDRHYSRLLSYRLAKQDDHEVEVFNSGEDVLDKLDNAPDLILLDIMMPGLDGIATLKQIRKRGSDVPVVMISAQGNVETAVEAMRVGAYDYITKGQDDLVKLDKVVEHIKERVSLSREVEALRGEVAEKYGLEEIVGDSKAMEEVYRLIQKTLRGDLTVAIQGESGTGKELVARAIHFNSNRKHGPFVVVNCAAIPSELMESEFFGHEKGSFTGAHARHIGKFEQADGGTLFLDEVGELDLGLQAKLLRALQNREITRVGGTGVISFECRVISATNRDVLKMVAEGTFREDLYYRLFQFPVDLPPLRDRGQDVLLLAHDVLKAYVAAHPQFKGKRLSMEAVEELRTYAWPGNVRELKSTIERAVLIADGDEIQAADLLIGGPGAIRPWAERTREGRPASGGDGQAPTPHTPPLEPVLSQPAEPPVRPGPASTQPVPSTQPGPAAAGTLTVPDAEGDPEDGPIVPLEELKRKAVAHAFRVCEQNVERAAGELGIGRATMYRLLKKYDIPTE